MNTQILINLHTKCHILQKATHFIVENNFLCKTEKRSWENQLKMYVSGLKIDEWMYFKNSIIDGFCLGLEHRKRMYSREYI